MRVFTAHSPRRMPRKSTPKVRNGKVQRKNPRDLRRKVHQPFVIRSEVPTLEYRHVVNEEDVGKFVSLLPEWDDLRKGLREIVLTDGDPGRDGWYCQGTVALCAWDRELTKTYETWYFREHEGIFRRLGVPSERVYVERLFSVDAWSLWQLDERALPDELLDQLDRTWLYRRRYAVEVVRPHREWLIKDAAGLELASALLADDRIDVYTIGHLCRFTEKTVRAYQLLHVLVHELGHHRDNVSAPAKGRCVRGEEYAEQYARKHERLIWDRYFDVFHG